MHEVANLGAPGVERGEKMLVVPDRVRPHALLIHEAVRRGDVGDFRQPRHRHAEQRAHAVLDDHAGINLRRQFAEHLEVEPRRRDLREVARVGKKGPAGPDRSGNHLRVTKRVNGHRHVTRQRRARIRGREGEKSPAPFNRAPSSGAVACGSSASAPAAPAPAPGGRCRPRAFSAAPAAAADCRR